MSAGWSASLPREGMRFLGETENWSCGIWLTFPTPPAESKPHRNIWLIDKSPLWAQSGYHDRSRQVDQNNSTRSFLRLAAGAATLSSLFPVSTTIATQSFAAATEPVSNSAARKVKFRDGALVPALGQDSWHLADGRRPAAVEEEALRTGLSLGMTLIDTAEVYGGGKSRNWSAERLPVNETACFWSPKYGPLMSWKMAPRAPARRVPGSALTTSIFICCTGQGGHPVASSIFRLL